MSRTVEVECGIAYIIYVDCSRNEMDELQQPALDSVYTYCYMKNLRLVIARIAVSDSLLVVPFADRLDFNIRRVFEDSDFVVLLKQLGMDSDEARLALEWSHPPPRSFELSLKLSEEQSRSLHSYFPLFVEALCSVA